MPNRIVWTRQAQEDLREVRTFIGRSAPATASAFVRRLRQSIERLREFPYSGETVPELACENIRELLRGNYRIIDRISPNRVEILTVYHSARLLDESDL
jgi:toxin ParE1/3/4